MWSGWNQGDILNSLQSYLFSFLIYITFLYFYSDTLLLAKYFQKKKKRRYCCTCYIISRIISVMWCFYTEIWNCFICFLSSLVSRLYVNYNILLDPFCFIFGVDFCSIYLNVKFWRDFQGVYNSYIFMRLCFARCNVVMANRDETRSCRTRQRSRNFCWSDSNHFNRILGLYFSSMKWYLSRHHRDDETSIYGSVRGKELWHHGVNSWSI